MAIPTVQGSNVIASPYAGVEANVQALSAPGRGMMAVGQAIGRAGEVVGEFAQRRQNAENEAAITKAQITIEKASDAYTEDMRLEPDEKKWQAGYEKKIGEVQAGLGLDKMAPVVREHLQNSLARTVARRSSDINSRAGLRSVERSRIQHTEGAEYYFMRGGKGDEELGRAELQAAVHTGAMFPEAAEAMEGDLIRKSQMNKGYGLIQDDAFGAEKQFTKENFPKLSDQQLYSLKNSALGEQAKIRTQTTDDIQSRRLQGETISDEEIHSLVQKGIAKPAWATGFLKQQSKDAKEEGMHGAEAAARYDELMTEAGAWDGQDLHAANKIRFAATEGLSPRLVTSVFERLDAKNTKKGGVLTGPVAKFALDSIELNFQAGTYGNFKTLDPADPLGTAKVTDPAKLAVATRYRAEIEDDLTKFLKSKPEATRGEVMAHLDVLNEKHVTKQGGEAINSFLGVPTQKESAQSAQSRWEALKKANAKK